MGLCISNIRLTHFDIINNELLVKIDHLLRSLGVSVILINSILIFIIINCRHKSLSTASTRWCISCGGCLINCRALYLRGRKLNIINTLIVFLCCLIYVLGCLCVIIATVAELVWISWQGFLDLSLLLLNVVTGYWCRFVITLADVSIEILVYCGLIFVTFLTTGSFGKWANNGFWRNSNIIQLLLVYHVWSTWHCGSSRSSWLIIKRNISKMTGLIKLYRMINMVLTSLIHHLSIFHFFYVDILTISHAITLTKIWNSSLDGWSVHQTALLTISLFGVLLLGWANYLALANTTSLVSYSNLLTLVVDTLSDLWARP